MPPGAAHSCLAVLFKVRDVSHRVLCCAVLHRVNPSALCIFISLWHIIVYCPLAHMVWHPTGIIKVLGVADFAGEAHSCMGPAERSC